MKYVLSYIIIFQHFSATSVTHQGIIQELKQLLTITSGGFN